MATQRVIVGTSLGVCGVVGVSQAGGLGIPLDGFLSTFVTWVIGLGWPVGIVGILGLVAANMDNAFGHMLAGSVRFFTWAGVLGGSAVILGALGLAQGGLLPL